MVTVQLPVARSQQAPVGGGGTGQVMVLQATLAPSQLKEHAVWVVTVQAPVAGSQQAPVGWHGLGEQTVP